MNPTWDPGRALPELFTVNERINQLVLANIVEDAWRAIPPGGKGRNIAEIFAHIHNVRIMWLDAAAKGTPNPGKIDKTAGSRDDVRIALEASARCVEALITGAMATDDGRIKSFKPNAAHFVAYLISHEAHHRGQVCLLARQAGFPLSKKAGFAMWEWGTLFNSG